MATNNTDIEIFGIDQLQKVLEDLPDVLGVELLQKINQEGAKVIKDEMKARAPVGNDTIQDAVKIERGREDKTSVLVGVGSKAFKARWIEFGTRNRTTSGKGPVQFGSASRGSIIAKPFVAPAVEASIDKAADTIWENLGKTTLRFLNAKLKKIPK